MINIVMYKYILPDVFEVERSALLDTPFNNVMLCKGAVHIEQAVRPGLF